MLYQNKEITQYFNDETMHVLDYDFEYLPGYLDAAKFPEYTNKVEDLKLISFLMNLCLTIWDIFMFSLL